MNYLTFWIYWLLGPWLLRRAKADRRWYAGTSCPHCGFDGFDIGNDPWFKCTRSGQSGGHGDITIYWFKGVQTCPRCWHNWDYDDSN